MRSGYCVQRVGRKNKPFGQNPTLVSPYVMFTNDFERIDGPRPKKRLAEQLIVHSSRQRFFLGHREKRPSPRPTLPRPALVFLIARSFSGHDECIMRRLALRARLPLRAPVPARLARCAPEATFPRQERAQHGKGGAAEPRFAGRKRPVPP